ncbi:MAG TPA: hypothetical protein VHK90_03880 [Thermoanaerobaculia bacterium]|nr:hypothetical protein [Thermoanaerobaculia bacterium]
MQHWKVIVPLVLVAIAALHYVSVPRAIWEFDEPFFTMAVEDYAPLVHHPPPPGYPLYIGFAKLVALFTGEPFRALLVTSIIAVAVGLVAFTFAFREISGSLPVGLVATALLYASPAVLVSGTLPQSDSGALALFGVAIWACARGNPYVMALACAAAIGWRVQFSIAIVPMFLVAVFQLKTWQERINALATFAAGCIAWLVPVVVATGGTEGFWSWLTKQASYYARHDADISRTGYSPSLIALRFLAHPWGPKFLSLPLLAVAVAGIRKNRRLIPLAAAGVLYFAFALATMDPADAVRYAIPGLPLVAVLAATALLSIPFAAIPIATTAAYIAGAYLYALPVVRTRAEVIAPPAAAAQWIRANVPRNAVVLYDLPLRPHAEYLLRGWRVMRLDAGLLQFGHRLEVPLVLLADGERATSPGVTFRWPDTDAYRKLTRKHYGAVSVIPLKAEERFRAVAGVYPVERTREGLAWRWISRRGILEFPRLGSTHVRVVLRTPPEYPFDENRVDVGGTVVNIRRGETKEVIVPLADQRVTITPEKTFVPSKLPGANNRDPRTLSVMLTRVEQLDPR